MGAYRIVESVTFTSWPSCPKVEAGDKIAAQSAAVIREKRIWTVRLRWSREN